MSDNTDTDAEDSHEKYGIVGGKSTVEKVKASLDDQEQEDSDE